MDYKEFYYKKQEEQKLKNRKAWVEFISYYRSYVDRFAEDVLGVELYPFQKLILRGMGRFQESMFIASRGIGKSWLSGLFLVCMAILYPEMKIGIVSGTQRQARLVISDKIVGELLSHPEIEREVKEYSTSITNPHIIFKNGSYIKAITLDQQRGGDSARGNRFNVLLIDEARLVSDKSLDEILTPMLRTTRKNVRKHDVVNIEANKIIQITSAYLKTHPIYDRFKNVYQNMIDNKNSFVCSLSYKVAVDAGLFREDDLKKDKAEMSPDIFAYEYEAIFVGSSTDSVFPYEIIIPTRTLAKPEFQQPKASTSEYVIAHDVALSGARKADNLCTHVIKLQPQKDGSYIKDVVYTETNHGVSLGEQRDRLRYLAHILFPNTVKIVLDIRGNAQPLPEYFEEVWTYEDPKTGETREYPPLVLDDDVDALNAIQGAEPMLRGIAASTSFNHQMYMYLYSSLESQTVRLLKPTVELDGEHKNMQDPKYVEQFLQADMLTQELINIKSEETDSGNIVYSQISTATRKDRVTSLGYGLYYIRGLEIDNRRTYNYNSDEYDPLVFI